MPEDNTIDAAVDAAFEQAFAKSETTETTEAPEAAAAEGAKPASGENLADALSTGGERERDEKGRFVAKDAGAAEKQAADPDATETAEAEPSATDETSDQGKVVEKAEPEAPKPPAIDPPQSWSAAERSHWGSLPPEVQQTVLRRESDFQRQMQQYAERIKQDPVRQALDPVRQQLQLSGTDEAAYIRSLVTAAQLLEQKPYEAIAWLAQQKGVDLARFAAPPEDDQNPIDPRLQALNSRVEQVTQYLAEQERRAQQQAAQAQQSMTQNLQKAIGDFAADPANRYYERVRDDMAALARAGVSDDLKTLYDRAIWSNPDIRAELEAERIAAARAELEAKFAAQRKQDQNAAAARKITSIASVTPKVRTDVPVKQPQNIRRGPLGVEDAVDAAFNDIFSG